MPQTLPPPPKGLGAIRDVFKSAHDASIGKTNALALPARKNIIVCLIDGLGAQQLRERSGHAGFLSAALKPSSIITCAYPATTSVNIGSLATGLTPGQHGFIGHQVWDRRHDERINLLVGWNERTDPLVWQPHSVIGESSEQQVNVIAAEEYRNTPFTTATMRGANFIAADDIDERIERAIEVLRGPGSVSYLYFPELDKYGHKNGWTSSGWAALLEQIDAGLARLNRAIPKTGGLIVTADHGMIETTKDRQLVLDEELDPYGLEFFGGDTRNSYLYLAEKSEAPRLVEHLRQFAHAFWAVEARELIDAGWFGEIGAEAADRMPEVALLARSNFTLYHSRFSKQRAFDMISHHGSISSAEMKVPLLRFGF